MASGRTQDRIKNGAAEPPEFVRLPPVGFWSYSRQDDELSFGKLSNLRKLLMAELQQQYGKERVHLFQDAETISHGAEWEREISTSLQQATFFIPIITPNFIQSEWCCREVAMFLQREQELVQAHPGLERRSRIFPFLLIDISGIDPHDEEVLAILHARQMFDYRALRFRNLQDEQVHQAIAAFAGSIRETLQIKVRCPVAAAAKARRYEEDRRHQEDAAAAERARQEDERLRREAAAAERARAEEQVRLQSEADARSRAAEEQRRRKAQSARQARREEARRRTEAQLAERALLEEQARREAETAELRRAEDEAAQAAERDAARKRREAYAQRELEGQAAAQAVGQQSEGPARIAGRPKSRLIVLAVLGVLVMGLIYLPTRAPSGPADPAAGSAKGTALATPPAAQIPIEAPPPPPGVDWLLGRWGVDAACREPVSVEGDRERLTLTTAGARPQVLTVRSVTADSIATDMATYTRDGESVRVYEPAIDTSYELKRCP